MSSKKRRSAKGGKAAGKKKDEEGEQFEFFPRLMNDEEWKDRKESFPKLTRENAYVTDPSVYCSYNCIGWSVQDLNLEYDVESVAEMVQFYKKKGFEQLQKGSPDAEVDLFSLDGYFASHASRKYTGPRPKDMPDGLWESALYPGERITHGRFEIEGDVYGKVTASFRRTAAPDSD